MNLSEQQMKTACAVFGSKITGLNCDNLDGTKEAELAKLVYKKMMEHPDIQMRMNRIKKTINDMCATVADLERRVEDLREEKRFRAIADKVDVSRETLSFRAWDDDGGGPVINRPGPGGGGQRGAMDG